MHSNPPTKNELFKALDYYFSNFPLKNTGLRVFNEIEKDGKKSEQEFLCIRRSKQDNSTHYYEFKEFDQDDFTKITEQGLANEQKLIALLFDAIKTHNDEIRTGKLGIIDRIIHYFNHDKTKIKYDPNTTFIYKELPKTLTQQLLTPFTLLNNALKWMLRTLVIDSIIAKYTIGWLITTIANKGNPHYTTELNSITDILGALIFPGGLKKPQIDGEGSIHLGPVLSLQFGALKQYQAKFKQDINKNIFNEFKLKVNKHTLIDGIKGNNKLVDSNSSQHLHVLYFNGNTGCYQDSAEEVNNDLLNFEKENRPVTSVQFNYPGVLDSVGKVDKAADLIQSGIALVEHLHRDLGVPYEQIGLRGVSLGGSIASHVASYYHSRGIDLYRTYASKTFSSTTNVAISYLHKIPVIGTLLGLLFRPFIAIGLWASQWQLDTSAHFASLPENKREYSVIRTPKYLRDMHEPLDDMVLTYYTSLHTSWRLKLQRFFHKNGWFNYDPNTYKETNQQRKMSVFHIDDSNVTYHPKLCGHAIHFNSSKKGLMLIHRNPTQDPKQLDDTEERIKGMEAGDRIHHFFSDKQSCKGNDSTEAQIIRDFIGLFK